MRICVAGQRFFCFFFPEQLTGLFFPGMGLGLLMPKFQLSKSLVGPCPAESFVLEVFPFCMEKRNFSGGAGSSLGQVMVHVHAGTRLG